MAQVITIAFICDRCGKREAKDERYCPHPSGYVSFGPVNGSNDEHIGARANKEKQHADICEPCRRGLLSWWRVGSDKCSDAT